MNLWMGLGLCSDSNPASSSEASVVSKDRFETAH